VSSLGVPVKLDRVEVVEYHLSRTPRTSRTALRPWSPGPGNA